MGVWGRSPQQRRYGPMGVWGWSLEETRSTPAVPAGKPRPIASADRPIITHRTTSIAVHVSSLAVLVCLLACHMPSPCLFSPAFGFAVLLRETFTEWFVAGSE